MAMFMSCLFYLLFVNYLGVQTLDLCNGSWLHFSQFPFKKLNFVDNMLCLIHFPINQRGRIKGERIGMLASLFCTIGYYHLVLLSPVM